MPYAFLGIIMGIVLGIIVPFSIPLEYSHYIAIAILAIFDSLFGGICAQIEKRFHVGAFITGLVFYMFLTAFIVYLGDKLNIDLYLGVIVVFVFRIMQNIGVIRTFYFQKFFEKDKEKTETHIEY